MNVVREGGGLKLGLLLGPGIEVSQIPHTLTLLRLAQRSLHFLLGFFRLISPDLFT